MKTLRRFLSLLLLALVLLPAYGCAVAHRYPAYRGRVLELGTDTPIEGAGVLAVYRKYQSGLVEATHDFLGYQAVLSDNTGRFTIPSRVYFSMIPLSWFDKKPFLSIYKKGYGNFPGSFSERRAKHGKNDPPIGPLLHPEGIDKEITFWLPKLETKEEIEEHDWLFSPQTTRVLDEKGFPPLGTRKGQFMPPIDSGERR